MDRKDCDFSNKDCGLACEACNSEAALLYWCETCQQQVRQKRCPHCGMKSRKVRQSPGK